jgi:hypothetical protein
MDQQEALAAANKLREEKGIGCVVFRSCWNCNPAHEHLKTVTDAVILCFGCGHYFYNGVQISTEEGEE